MIWSYRDADLQKQKREDCLAWQQGLYFWNALVSVLGSMFSKAKQTYPEEPFSIKQEKQDAAQRELTEDEKALLARVYMEEDFRKNGG